MDIIKGKALLSSIAENCDHAMTRDSLGFSKTTASLGHVLNALPVKQLNDDMQKALFRVLWHHKRQLSISDQELASLATVSDEATISEHHSKVVAPMLYTTKGGVMLWTPKDRHILSSLVQFLGEMYSEFNLIPVEVGVEVFIPREKVALFANILVAHLNENKSVFSYTPNLHDEEPHILLEGTNGYTHQHFDVAFKVFDSELLELLKINEFNVRYEELDMPSQASFTLHVHKTPKGRYATIESLLETPLAQKLLDEIRPHSNSDADLGQYQSVKLPSILKNLQAPIVRIEAIDAIKQFAKDSKLEMFIDSKLKGFEGIDSFVALATEAIEASRPKITFGGNQIFYHFPYDEDIVSTLRECKNKRFDRDNGWHVVTLTKSNIEVNLNVMNLAIKKHNFLITEDNQKSLNTFADQLTQTDDKKCVSFNDDGEIIASFDFNWDDYREIKSLGRKKSKYHPATQTWSLLESKYLPEACSELKKLGWIISNEVEKLCLEISHRSASLSKNKKTLFKLSGETNVLDQSIKQVMNGVGYDYQYTVVEYSKLTKRFIIGDTMGLGKTIEALLVTEYHKAEQTLLLCPATAAPNWDKHINQFVDVSKGDVYRIKKVRQFDAAKLAKARYVIVHYDILKRLAKKLIESAKFDSVILDESHRIKHEKTQWTIAANELKEHFKFEIRLLLSGTVLTGRPKDLINQLKFLDLLDDEFGGFFNFTQTYCGGHYNEFNKYDYSGSGNEEALNKKLRETCFIRRTRKDVGEQLPSKRRNVVTIDIPESIEKRYAAAEKEFIKEMLGGIKERAEEEWQSYKSKKLPSGEKRAKKADFMEMAVAKETARVSEGDMLVRSTVLQNIVAEAKVNPAIAYCEDHLDNKDDEEFRPLVVYSYRTEIQEGIYNHFSGKEGVRVGRIHSKANSEKRFQVQEDFEKGKYDLLVCSIAAAAENISLPRSNRMLITDVVDRPEKYLQTEDRILRITSRGDFVDIDYMIMAKTIDTDVWARHKAKTAVMGKVLDGQLNNDFDFSSSEENSLEYSTKLKSLMLEKLG